MTPPPRHPAQPWLTGLALFAFLWAAARAHVQSITIDEADTYLAWAARPDASHWIPASNNHVLNSLLMRLCTSVFGPSHLAVRAPALLGALLYMGASWWLCRALTPSRSLACATLLCLVCNPFVLDYLVAARGYSLAAGFLLAALALADRGRDRPAAASALCSACLALSAAANFSFAFVDAAALLLIYLRFRRACPGQRRLAACVVVPALAVTLLISAPALLHWPRGELRYGAASLRETLASVAEASLYEPNPHLANPLLRPVLRGLAPLLFPLLGVFALGRLAVMALQRPIPREGPQEGPPEGWPGPVGTAAASILSLALSAHWIAFRWFHLLLPKDRTALYLAPLATLAIASVAALPHRSAPARFFGRGLAVLLGAAALYFVFCLRLTYFKEWKWDADVQAVYRVLARYNRECGVRDIASSWHYVAPLNFYRRQSGLETISEFTSAVPYPLDREVYVLHGVFDQPFIAEQNLQIVYRGDISDVVVAVRPEIGRRAVTRLSVP